MKLQRPIHISVLIFSIIIIFTLVSWYTISSQYKQSNQIRFEETSTLITEAIHQRLDIYISALRSGEGLFSSSDVVDRDEFQTYVESLALQEFYPGIQAYGYSVFLQPDEVAAHEAQIQAEGFPDYQIRPEGTRDMYSSIVYIEPFDVRNQQAFGYDMYSEANRRAAMSGAASTGLPHMSQRVTLVQEIDSDVQPGFLVYVPHYTNGVSVETQAERQEHIESFIYAAFRARDFMNNLLPEEVTHVEFAIHDGSSNALDEDTLMFRSRDNGYFANLTEAPESSSRYFHKTIDIQSADWTIHFYDEIGESVLSQQALVTNGILTGGFLLALLVSLLLYFLATSQTRAHALANKMTKSLKNERSRLEEMNVTLQSEVTEREIAQKQLEEKNESSEKEIQLMTDREIKMIEQKARIKELEEELEQHKNAS